MIIYRAVLEGYITMYFFSEDDCLRQLEEWETQGCIGWSDEIFVYGNNPFCNNQELID